MTDSLGDAAAGRWFPIATELDLPDRHIFHGQLLGRELAVWRADDGFVNVWENRCLHRGVRLSIGTNDGVELTCRYHGWRYSSRSAGCTYIPAHPADAPARTIFNRTFPVTEKYGLVWSGEAPEGEAPGLAVLDEGAYLALRSLPVNAPPSLVLDELAGHRFLPSQALGGPGPLDEVEITAVGDDAMITLTSTLGKSQSTVVFFVQPVDSNRSVIRPVLAEAAADEFAVLRHHADELKRFVGAVEAKAEALPTPEPLVARLEESPVLLPATRAPTGRAAPLRVTVARKWQTADQVAAFELTALQGKLPTFQPGAHIDVHLPNGLIRQYSLTNGPGDVSFYRIGVKREPDSTGGSEALHASVRQGDVLAISEPRNNFALRRDHERTLLIAGGIGITPMIAMAQALANMDLAFELHYFAQAESHLAFPELRADLGDAVVPHLGRSPDETGADLQALLADVDVSSQVYACGPGPMLDAVRTIAATAGWPDESVHFEYFKNTNEIDDSTSFTVALARSALTLEVPSGASILDVLRDNGVEMPSSCEQGACGTCAATVIEGEPVHQDVYLNATERAAGTTIMTCVSRTSSERLVLDL